MKAGEKSSPRKLRVKAAMVTALKCMEVITIIVPKDIAVRGA
jgi:hypothetical protein